MEQWYRSLTFRNPPAVVIQPTTCGIWHASNCSRVGNSSGGSPSVCCTRRTLRRMTPLSVTAGLRVNSRSRCRMSATTWKPPCRRMALMRLLRPAARKRTRGAPTHCDNMQHLMPGARPGGSSHADVNRLPPLKPTPKTWHCFVLTTCRRSVRRPQHSPHKAQTVCPVQQRVLRRAETEMTMWIKGMQLHDSMAHRVPV